MNCQLGVEWLERTRLVYCSISAYWRHITLLIASSVVVGLAKGVIARRNTDCDRR